MLKNRPAQCPSKKQQLLSTRLQKKHHETVESINQAYWCIDSFVYMFLSQASKQSSIPQATWSNSNLGRFNTVYAHRDHWRATLYYGFFAYPLFGHWKQTVGKYEKKNQHIIWTQWSYSNISQIQAQCIEPFIFTTTSTCKSHSSNLHKRWNFRENPLHQ